MTVNKSTKAKLNGTETAHQILRLRCMFKSATSAFNNTLAAIPSHLKGYRLHT